MKKALKEKELEKLKNECYQIFIWGQKWEKYFNKFSVTETLPKFGNIKINLVINSLNIYELEFYFDVNFSGDGYDYLLNDEKIIRKIFPEYYKEYKNIIKQINKLNLDGGIYNFSGYNKFQELWDNIVTNLGFNDTNVDDAIKLLKSNGYKVLKKH